MPQPELAKRIAVAAVGIPVAIAVVYFGGWVMGGLLALLAAGGAYELYRLAEARGVRPFVLPGVATAAAYVLLAAARPVPGEVAGALWMLTVLLVLYLGISAVRVRDPDDAPLAGISVTVLGALLTGGTLAYALFLRHLLPDQVLNGSWGPWHGAALVAFPLGLTWINDTAAYAFGKTLGRRKLIPRVSPGKTVEGSLAGVVLTILAGAAFAAFVFEGWMGLPIGALWGAIGGGLVAVAAQLGDLAESLLKREAGVKDSGTIFPGHGGILDRFDALYFTIPVAYWFLALVLALETGSDPWG
jgi:phosphatidate cytidylyltransferase